jgi:hypothetical protein
VGLIKKYAEIHTNRINTIDTDNLKTNIEVTTSLLDSSLRVISFAPIISSPNTASIEKKEMKANAKLS